MASRPYILLEFWTFFIHLPFGICASHLWLDLRRMLMIYRTKHSRVHSPNACENSYHLYDLFGPFSHCSKPETWFLLSVPLSFLIFCPTATGCSSLPPVPLQPPDDFARRPASAWQCDPHLSSVQQIFGGCLLKTNPSETYANRQIGSSAQSSG